MDEETKQLIRDVVEEWIEAEKVLVGLNPKLKDATMERIEAVKTVVQEVNDFKVSAHINRVRFGGGKKGVGVPLATGKQRSFLEKKGLWRDGMDVKEASALIGGWIREHPSEKKVEGDWFGR